MEVRDIHSLFEQYLVDGFTLESLSKASNVSLDVIRRCYDKEKLSNEDVLESGKVLDILGQIYMSDVDSETYLKNVVETLEWYFELPRKAIMSYIGLNAVEFESFLDKPSEYPNGFKLSIKLMHLRNVLAQGR